MGHFSFLVMATPRKENKRCHLTTGQTPNEKRNRPGGHKQGHIGSRKSLAYDSVEQNNKLSFLHILFSTCSCFFVLIYFYLFTIYCTSRLRHASGECCKELLWLPPLGNASQKSTLGPKLKTGPQSSSLQCTKMNRPQTTSGQPWDQKRNTGVWLQDILNLQLEFSTFAKVNVVM